ncbi:MAG: DUF4013 domain-containing protein [Thermoflexales bacterium]
MNISRAIQHPTQDPNFIQKLAITSLVGMVPILNFAVQGYALEHAANVMAGRELPLPGWSDLSARFNRGLRLGLAQLVYAAPLLFLYGVLMTAILVFTFGAQAAIYSGQASRDVSRFLGVGSVALFGIMAVLGGALFFLGIAIGLLGPGIFRQYLQHGTFGSCFQFGEILAFTRRRIGNIMLSQVILYAIVLAPILGSMFLQFIPCLGSLASFALMFAALGYYQIVHAHLMGQMMLKDSQVPAPPVRRQAQ